jgi:hypothetical protein
MSKNDISNAGKAFRSSNALLGGVLVLLGIVFLLGELFNIHVGQYVWPFFIVGIGVALFLLALGVESEAGQALAIVGSIVGMVGLILLYQNVTDHWASWSYAWALIAPTAPGIGLFLFGTLRDRPEAVKSGAALMKVGLSIFVVAAVFFELIIGVGGLGVGRYGWPLLLIILGILLLARNMTATWRHT